MIKKVCAVLLLYVLWLPFVVSASTLPTCYSSNEADFAQRLPQVRNQWPYFDCWAFAATGAVEYSAAKNDHMDFSDEKNLFSEYHMAASMNITENERYKAFTRTKIMGGNRESAVAYMTRSIASGPVLSCRFDNESYDYYLADRKHYEWLLYAGKKMMLTKARFITSGTEASSVAEYSEDGQRVRYYKNDDVIEKIKKAVRDYGAVSSSYYSYEKTDDRYYNSETCAYAISWDDMLNAETPDGNFCKFTTDGYRFKVASNHAVVIVGWDDNYPWQNFKAPPVSFDGVDRTPENGAWIVRNSWGEEFGNGGYEYISYMDPTIGLFATAYEVEPMVAHSAYTHTNRGMMNSVLFPDTGYGVYAVNRFNGIAGDVITSVGIYMCDILATAEILIDTNPGEELKTFTYKEFLAEKLTLVDIETGTELKKIKPVFPGYYLYRLKKPVKLTGDFDVYIRYKVSEKSDFSLPVGNELNTEAPYKPGGSFYAYMTGGGGVYQWKDIGVNWCVNAYATKSAFEIPEVKIKDNNVTATFIRYDNAKSATAFVTFYSEDKVIGLVRAKPQFDENGIFVIKEALPAEADSAKAFLWTDSIVYRK